MRQTEAPLAIDLLSRVGVRTRWPSSPSAASLHLTPAIIAAFTHTHPQSIIWKFQLFLLSPIYPSIGPLLWHLSFLVLFISFYPQFYSTWPLHLISVYSSCCHPRRDSSTNPSDTLSSLLPLISPFESCCICLNFPSNISSYLTNNLDIQLWFLWLRPFLRVYQTSASPRVLFTHLLPLFASLSRLYALFDGATAIYSSAYPYLPYYSVWPLYNPFYPCAIPLHI